MNHAERMHRSPTIKFRFFITSSAAHTEMYYHFTEESTGYNRRALYSASKEVLELQCQEAAGRHMLHQHGGTDLAHTRPVKTSIQPYLSLTRDQTITRDLSVLVLFSLNLLCLLWQEEAMWPALQTLDLTTLWLPFNTVSLNITVLLKSQLWQYKWVIYNHSCGCILNRFRLMCWFLIFNSLETADNVGSIQKHDIVRGGFFGLHCCCDWWKG